MGYQHLSEV